MRTPTALATAAALATIGALCGVVAAAGPAGAAGGCTPTAIHRGTLPAWTAPAWADSSPGFRLPYALASGDSAAAFFWVDLRAGDPSNPANKLLWVMRYARRGTPLRILARWGGDPAVSVRSSWPADSSPGEIYPSYLNLPRAGCWALTIRWSSHAARLAVQIAPAGSTSHAA